MYTHTQKQTNFAGAHESLDSHLGDIFCRPTFFFPSLTIYFFAPVSHSADSSEHRTGSDILS
jgi:hypothetical protein